jgi:hypothetical protein
MSTGVFYISGKIILAYSPLYSLLDDFKGAVFRKNYFLAYEEQFRTLIFSNLRPPSTLLQQAFEEVF